ncbi:hypothetical protein EDB81DRAFT_874766 [Dactylonectria macrodidyma]|uniref:DUF7924 domain-containing protein n=1 Tax=Dactylonectria macrodidyma TaxID=307937 RepID=A0A9P9FT31_9HYPO|nr:hypothetical protein EDB81DRAFT_874766 [Dactylonectria macrodidyma]
MSTWHSQFEFWYPARGITELFRLVKRKDEIQRQILAFSISHDHRSVRIYGYYPVLDKEDDPKYYRHPIHTFDFTALDGKEKWTAYQFIKNVYDPWMPKHLKRICSAIDQLDFDTPSEGTGLSQSLASYSLRELDVESMPSLMVKDSQSDIVDQQTTPSTSLSKPGAKRRRSPVKRS